MQSESINRPDASHVDADAGVDVSVVIVNYNVREFLDQALRSVESASAGLSVEIFVVDNNSSDGSAEMIRQRFPSVRLIANEENTGFSTANNQAIREASGRYLLILNPDTIVREDTLHWLVAFMDEHPEAGAVGCKILNPDGTFAPESRRAFPTPEVAFYRITGLSKLFPGSRRFGRYNMSYLPPDAATEVDALSGSCMMVRHEALLRRAEQAGVSLNGAATRTYAGAGLFDEDFFMYGEDLDWCYRIQQAGWKIYYTPGTQIIHYKGESTKKGELRYVMLFYGAMLRFAEKHFKSRHSALFRFFLRAGIVARGGLQVASNGLRRFAGPMREALVVFAMVALGGLIRFQRPDLSFPPLYLGLIAPLYTAAAILSISALGGYSLRGEKRLLPVIGGSGAALAFLAATSFFFKNIAFSRLAIVLSFGLSLIALCGVRLLRGHRNQAGKLFRRAVLVGDREEATRFQHSLASAELPSMDIVGYVGDTPVDSEAGTAPIPFIGARRHLRDVVRLQKIDDVIFASSVLSNRTIFDLIQQLRGLPVSLKILSPNLEHLIGPTRVDELATPALIDANRALSIQRSTFARRAFEMPLALMGMLAHPVLAITAKLAGRRSWLHMVCQKTRLLHTVWTGKRALVGYRDDEAAFIRASWHLKPGVFTITDTLPPRTPAAQDIDRAYWLYVCNQSISLDLDIIYRSIQHMRTKQALDVSDS